MKDTILSRLKKVKPQGKDKYMACCPAHDDRTPSLRVTFLHDGRVLMNCFAGCDTLDVVHSMGLEMTDLFPDGAIRDHMAACRTAERKRNIDDKDVYLLNIGKARREQGQRMSQADLKAEREAYLRTRGQV